MGDRALQTLITGGHFFEGPRWRDGRWWVSDFYSHTVSTVTTDGVQETACEVPGQPSGLGWLPDGSLLIGSMRDHRVLRRTPDGQVQEYADLTEHCGGKLNDLVVSADGRTYAGNFGFDLMGGVDPTTASLIRIDSDRSVHVAALDLHFPNGAVITPDGSTLIVGETLGGRYTSFRIGPDGELTDRAVWAEFAPLPPAGSLNDVLAVVGVAPDGCTLDAEGYIWFADALGGRVARAAPGGQIVDEIAAPEGLNFYACALGGEDGRTLLMCGAPDFFEGPRQAAREAVLITAQVDAPHAGLP
ncbi:MAG: SMP-30/gluconolactonase/LRE family protein [Geodermatophilaceae bacterium]|jgi:sugar lactone lactonase YvrE|nr:SMP-30/gluconolactonase/LRE family protein [Geodermatophilaceae bacterium]MDQ3464469.1 SMP-30/gluconolactonase/LRE family protein [Actinomycetota bacterium]